MARLRPFRLLKKLSPRGLFGRSLIIIVAPMVALQGIVTYAFFERHYDIVTRHMAHSVAGDVAFLTTLAETYPAGGERTKLLGMAAHALVFALALPLGGCLGETFQRGYVLPEGALEQIRLGASQEQVLIVLGTPSTVATVSGEAFYYISQRAERPIAFMPTQITDQRVVAVYFDKNRRVARVASYGIKDGEIFDFVGRTTPTAGSDINLLKSMLQSLQGAHIGLPF